MGLFISGIGNVSLFTQNLKGQFNIRYDNDKLKVILNNKEEIKKNLRVFVRKDSTNEIIRLNLNNSKTEFELEWKYFLDPRSLYTLFLTTYNNEGQLRKNVRLNEKYLDNFVEENLTLNGMKVKIFKNKKGDIRLQSY